MVRYLKWSILSAFIVLSLSSPAQLIEFGGGFGGMSYAGDLSRGIKLTNQNFAFQGHYRMNLSKIVSTKFSVTIGSISGNDSNPIDPAAALRNAQFSRTMLEGAASFEYHFLDYKNDKSRIKFSPYLFGGFGFIKIYDLDPEIDTFSSLQPVIPFGVGIKHLVGKRFSIDLELGARKLFFDHIDRVSDADVLDGNGLEKNFQYGNPNDQDWYHYAGVSISYILYNIPCLYKYIPNKSIYN